MPAHVPDKVVDRGLPRPLPDNTASIATWLDAREPAWRGDLTRNRSDPTADLVLRGGACFGNYDPDLIGHRREVEDLTHVAAEL